MLLLFLFAINWTIELSKPSFFSTIVLKTIFCLFVVKNETRFKQALILQIRVVPFQPRDEEK